MRLVLFIRQRQRRPQLKAVVHIGLLGPGLGTALGVHDAAPRAHPVDGTRLDPLVVAKTVAVLHRPFQQIGHRRESDVGMRTHVDARIRRDRHRPEMI